VNLGATLLQRKPIDNLLRRHKEACWPAKRLIYSEEALVSATALSVTSWLAMFLVY
jgi:hypothetical protein